MRLLRQLTRRKLRTTLTILGITIGIWALVVFSSMANKINALVEGGSQYFAGKVLVTDASSLGVSIGTAPMNIDVAAQVAELDGVAAAVPQIQLVYDPEGGGAFGSGETIIGSVPGADNGLETFPLTAILGRLLTAEDEGRAARTPQREPCPATCHDCLLVRGRASSGSAAPGSQRPISNPDDGAAL